MCKEYPAPRTIKHKLKNVELIYVLGIEITYYSHHGIKDWPNDAKEATSFLFKGRLQDNLVLLDDFVASLQALDASLSLDLFGDAARLVRRFVL